MHKQGNAPLRHCEGCMSSDCLTRITAVALKGLSNGAHFLESGGFVKEFGCGVRGCRRVGYHGRTVEEHVVFFYPFVLIFSSHGDAGLPIELARSVASFLETNIQTPCRLCFSYVHDVVDACSHQGTLQGNRVILRYSLHYVVVKATMSHVHRAR